MVSTIIDFEKIERKWQRRWEKEKAFVVKDSVKGKKKYYNLEMYPYPSGQGIHMGHALNYTIGDIRARLKRMQGFNVLYPTGFDSFGLPAENAAIKAKEHPKKFTEDAIKNFVKQVKGLGISYDWMRMIKSHDTEYYRWDQWIFLKMFEKGLAYRKKAPVNYCRKCKTVLANEQVVNGKCWRHEDEGVDVKQLEQWFLKTTAYADELLEGLDKLDGWPELIKKLQRNWIGKSEGAEVDFEVDGKSSKKDKVILVDAVHTLVDKNGKINVKLKKYLDSIDNRKIILTNAPFDKHNELFSKVGDYEIFTLENKFNKTNSNYYRKFLDKFNLDVNQVIYFEHDEESVESARSVGIETYFYEGDVNKTKDFIESSLRSGEKWSVFTTRVDTLFGVTFLVVSVQHPELMGLVTKERKEDVENFLREIKSTKEEDMDKLEKGGVFTGSYALHPLTGEKIPIWCGNFVVADYGSGMVMGVPAHDERDFEFAKKYKLPIKMVICPHYPKKTCPILNEAYTGYGHLVDSGGFNGLKSMEAKEHITNALEMEGKGRKKVAYRLKDWLISRQRFWGTPIPVIYCDSCGVLPVSEKDLPVRLPENIKFTGTENPLKSYKPFVDVKCHMCGKVGRRETDTMDTFVNSSWYFLRFCDPRNGKRIFDGKKVNYWMPIDQYIGGKEHAYLHLIYFRFYTKFLRDLGLFDKSISEPVLNLFNQGYIYGKDGRKMSKSYGNVVNPTDIVSKYGADVLRWFLVSVASPDKDFNWDDNGIEGSLRFVLRVMEFVNGFKQKKITELQKSKLNRTIRDYTSDLEGFRYNLAVIKLREFFSVFEEGIDKKSLEVFLKLFSVICPHVSEELWSKLGNKKFISLEKWPLHDVRRIDDKLEEREKEVEKTIEDVRNILKIIEDKGKHAKRVNVYVLPQEIGIYDGEKMSERVGVNVDVWSVSDKNKNDPEGKSKKVKPGRPGIYVE